MPKSLTITRLTDIYSKTLSRDTTVEIFLPPHYEKGANQYPLLILNDGQDSEAVQLKKTLEELMHNGQIPHLIVAGVFAGDRMQEYGVAAQCDYKKRGSKAKAYSQFLINELLPYLKFEYSLSNHPHDHAIAGYSLGGLSAVDIAWHHTDFFGKVGAFSGSFWWRRRDANSRFYSEQQDRIMHRQIRHGRHKPGLKFWFQTGTRDEVYDRNKNGVIDSIDDTLDLIVELTKKGYRPFHDIQYLEIENGEHNTKTWGEAMPHFLTWAFGKKTPLP